MFESVNPILDNNVIQLEHVLFLMFIGIIVAIGREKFNRWQFNSNYYLAMLQNNVPTLSLTINLI